MHMLDSLIYYLIILVEIFYDLEFLKRPAILSPKLYNIGLFSDYLKMIPSPKFLRLTLYK